MAPSRLSALLLLLPLAEPLRAEPSLHDATSWSLVAPPPGSERAAARLDIEFGTAAGRALRLDAWLPDAKAGAGSHPAVVFLGGLSDSARDPMRRWRIHQSWMKAVAAHGFVGVMGDVEPSAIEESYTQLFRFLAERGAEIGVDPSRLALFAASANVQTALPFSMGSGAPSGLRAAVFLYGASPPLAVRADLPVLYVVAGRDSMGVTSAGESLLESARQTNAPWIFVEALDVPHAFDALDLGNNSRALVRQVLDFIDEHLAPPASASEPEPARSAREGLAALYGRDFARAREVYERISQGPAATDPQVWKNLAWACEGSGDQAATLAALDRALALDPTDRSSLRSVGFAAFRLGDWARAEQTLALLGNDADPIAIEALGLARLKLGRPADAASSLALAVEKSGSRDTRYNLACALALAGDHEGAIRELERAVTDGYLSPDLGTDPDLASLHGDPRFQKLVEKMPAAVSHGSDGQGPSN